MNVQCYTNVEMMAMTLHGTRTVACNGFWFWTTCSTIQVKTKLMINLTVIAMMATISAATKLPYYMVLCRTI